MGYSGMMPRGSGGWNENFQRKGYNPDGTMKESYSRLLICWGVAAIFAIIGLLEMNWGLLITIAAYIVAAELSYFNNNSLFDINDYFKIPRDLDSKVNLNSVHCLKNGVTSAKSEFKDGGFYLDLKDKANLIKLHDLKFESPLLYRKLIWYTPQVVLLIFSIFSKAILESWGETAFYAKFILWFLPGILLLMISLCRMIQVRIIRLRVRDFVEEILNPGTHSFNRNVE